MVNSSKPLAYLPVSYPSYLGALLGLPSIGTLDFMKEFYNGGFLPGFSVSMLKESIAIVRDYVSETRK